MIVYLVYNSYLHERPEKELISIFLVKEKAEQYIDENNFAGCIYEIEEWCVNGIG